MYEPGNVRDEQVLHNFAIDADIDNAFVGRQNELNLLKDALQSSYRFLGIFGIRSVGKSRLVKEFLIQYLTEKINQVRGIGSSGTEPNTGDAIPIVIRVDLKHQTDISAVYANICACLGEKPVTDESKGDTGISQIVRCLNDSKNKQFIIFFDDFESAEDNSAEDNSQFYADLINLIIELIRTCLHVKVFITSSVALKTSLSEHAVFCHELQPLTPSESTELFRVIAPDVKLGVYADPIMKLSEGLPLLISMIANELADDSGMISPQEMLELLATSRLKCLSRHEFYAREDCIADVYKAFLEKLHTIYRNRLAVLGFIPGSFDIRQARGILGYATDHEVADKALVPIRRRYMLNFDPVTGRFNIQGILRECLQVFYTIRNISEVRKRFCETFTSVMLEIAEKLGTEEYVKAMAEFSLEQANFQKLMTEVYNTNEDTYNFFITMATRCTDLMEQFMLKECEEFYDGCLLMADRYGNTVDKAMVNIAVGSMWTNAKGELQKGAEQYNCALKVLISCGSRLQLATAFQRTGWNLHRQGRNQEAIGYFHKTLKLSHCGGGQLQRLTIQSMNSLGLSNTILGHFEEAGKYLFGALKRAKAAYTNDHPSIGGTINNIGVFYETKGDSENALKFYQEGLEIKKRNKAPATSITISMTNVANEYTNLRKFEKAHELLDEGLDLQQRQKVPSQTVLALAYDTKGKVFIAEKRYDKAIAMFEKSTDIGRRLAPEGITYAESLANLAFTKQRLGKFKSCIRTANEVICIKDNALKSKPQKSFMADCYECLAEVYQKTGNNEKQVETLELLEEEFIRLEQVHACSFNESRMAKLSQQLDDVRKRIHSLVQGQS